MTLRFSCRCGRKLKANPSLAGTMSFCPSCGETLQVPREAPAAETTPAMVHAACDAQPERYPLKPKQTRRRRRPAIARLAVVHPGAALPSAPLPSAPLPSAVGSEHGSVFVAHADPAANRRERRTRSGFEASCDLLDGAPHLFRISGGLAVLSSIAVFLYPLLLRSGTAWINGWLMAVVHTLASALLMGYGVRFLDDLLDSVLFAGRRRFTLDLDPLTALVSALRWGISILCGPTVFAFLAARHWVRCGDPTPVDVLILLELGMVGATWWVMSVLVLARRPELVWVSPARAFNAACTLGPRVLLAGFLLALVGGVHVRLAMAAATLLHSGLSGFFALWLLWFSGWYCSAYLIRITGVWYHDSRPRREAVPHSLAGSL